MTNDQMTTLTTFYVSANFKGVFSYFTCVIQKIVVSLCCKKPAAKIY